MSISQFIVASKTIAVPDSVTGELTVAPCVGCSSQTMAEGGDGGAPRHRTAERGRRAVRESHLVDEESAAVTV